MNLEDRIKAKIKEYKDIIKEQEVLMQEVHLTDESQDWAMRSHYEGIIYGLEWTLKELMYTIQLEFQIQTKGENK
jgi:hypothetical protein